jgi:hypothetical protein
VDDIFAVWPHGKDDPQGFLQHLNNIHKSIEFTMEAEQDRTVPFLDVLVSRRLDGTLGHTVYRKSTHTDLYPHAKSEHHPAQKRTVLTTLIRRAKTLCDPDSLGKEIQHLRDTFQRNRYSKSEIRRALHPKLKPEQKNNKLTGIAVLPYQQAVSNKISRFITKYNIKTVHVPKKKNRQLLRTAKDDLGLKIPGVYRIPCECGCGKVYIGQTGRSVEARCKQHMRHIRLDQPEKSAVAERSINTGHQIDLNNVSVLD